MVLVIYHNQANAQTVSFIWLHIHHTRKLHSFTNAIALLFVGKVEQPVCL
ncbi:hypothetical protein IQ244_31555 [Nostoc sp. LEGE 06077]|nr:hypothetical protein [Nostoc sp. LEGE 06077]MBE9210958.1 hypothetical protein [Nostoc sp. LEGE 06077]